MWWETRARGIRCGLFGFPCCCCLCVSTCGYVAALKKRALAGEGGGSLPVVWQSRRRGWGGGALGGRRPFRGHWAAANAWCRPPVLSPFHGLLTLAATAGGGCILGEGWGGLCRLLSPSPPLLTPNLASAVGFSPSSLASIVCTHLLCCCHLLLSVLLPSTPVSSCRRGLRSPFYLYRFAAPSPASTGGFPSFMAT